MDDNKIIVSTEGVELGDWSPATDAEVLEAYAAFVADKTGLEVELGGHKESAPADVNMSELWGEFCAGGYRDWL
jgi:hypothetical protein